MTLVAFAFYIFATVAIIAGLLKMTARKGGTSANKVKRAKETR